MSRLLPLALLALLFVAPAGVAQTADEVPLELNLPAESPVFESGSLEPVYQECKTGCYYPGQRFSLCAAPLIAQVDYTGPENQAMLASWICVETCIGPGIEIYGISEFC